jgi:hypothetical protein
MILSRIAAIIKLTEGYGDWVSCEVNTWDMQTAVVTMAIISLF